MRSSNKNVLVTVVDERIISVRLVETVDKFLYFAICLPRVGFVRPNFDKIIGQNISDDKRSHAVNAYVAVGANDGHRSWRVDMPIFRCSSDKSKS